jgi:C-terminal processing protease CtpA/Prc
MDRGCASACEGGLARFLSHPYVKTYGTNTQGGIHYGDTVPLVLPHSGVVVAIPTTFRAFADDRFLEKIGYTPDVPVEDGHDALEEALQDLAQLWE